MRRTVAGLRQFLPQEFLARKVTKRKGGELDEVVSVVGSVHVFSLSKKEALRQINEQDHIQPFHVHVVPLTDYVFPSFWKKLNNYVEKADIEGCFLEGCSEQYLRRPPPYNRPSNALTRRWSDFKMQRMVPPLEFPYPTKNFGADVEAYSKLQQFFPRLRPKYDTDEKRMQRVDVFYDKVCATTVLYHTPTVASLFDYKFCPTIAERLLKEGYSLRHKVDIDLGSEENEKFEATMRFLLAEANRAAQCTSDKPHVV